MAINSIKEQILSLAIFTWVCQPVTSAGRAPVLHGYTGNRSSSSWCSVVCAVKIDISCRFSIFFRRNASLSCILIAGEPLLSVGVQNTGALPCLRLVPHFCVWNWVYMAGLEREIQDIDNTRAHWPTRWLSFGPRLTDCTLWRGKLACNLQHVGKFWNRVGMCLGQRRHAMQAVLNLMH